MSLKIKIPKIENIIKQSSAIVGSQSSSSEICYKNCRSSPKIPLGFLNLEILSLNRKIPTVYVTNLTESVLMLTVD